MPGLSPWALALPVTTCVQASSPLQVPPAGPAPTQSSRHSAGLTGMHLWKVLEVSVTLLHTVDTQEPHGLGTEPGEGGQ